MGKYTPNLNGYKSIYIILCPKLCRYRFKPKLQICSLYLNKSVGAHR